MTDYGASDTSTTTLGANQFPISEVYVPNDALRALEGGPVSTDGGGKKSSPASMYVKDGGDVAQGLTTDAAVTGDNSGTVSAKLRGLTKIFADIWDSVNHRIKVDGSGVTQPANITQIGGVTTQMMSGDGVAQANFPMFGIGLYNNSGNVVDRLRDAGSIGDGVTIGLISAQQMLFNGGSADRARTPTTFVPIAAQSITAGTPVAVWTPAGGRKFHLMGYCVTSTVAASIIFKDGATEIFRVPVLAGAPVVNPGNFGNGYPGTTSNQALNFDVTTTGVVSGFVFGTSEF